MVDDTHECTVIVRYLPASPDGWPWTVSQDGGRRVLTITDLDDSSLGILLRAIAQAGAGRQLDETALDGTDRELATT